MGMFLINETEASFGVIAMDGSSTIVLEMKHSISITFSPVVDVGL
uniref:Uncharacterized protein n=1 Tax=Arundo donax TaxID=35708 RepID=A0A0A8XWX8_ARUDO